MDIQKVGAVLVAAIVFPILSATNIFLVKLDEYDTTTTYTEKDVEYPLFKTAVATTKYTKFVRKNREIRKRLDKKVRAIMDNPTIGTSKTQRHPDSMVPPILERLKREGLPIENTKRWYEVGVPGNKDLRIAYITFPETWGLNEESHKRDVIEDYEIGKQPSCVILFLAIGRHQDILGKKYNAEDSN